ncbi:sialidase family protein [Reichenbachiella sp. MALMAid0571]|uniref:sialidase family protein n=1 Tax=Reichenbachiella sp. MALMAid0571 TaxID=3143939 RepID=UPI0032DEA35B
MQQILKCLNVVLLVFVYGSAVAQDQSVPALAKVGEGGLLKSELIYALEGRQTPECHASTIVEIDGGLAAAWFGGTEEKDDDVGIWVSRNTNGKWSTPVEVANGIQNKKLRYPCWNPVLFQPKQGPLMLFYKVGPDPRTWWGMLITSKDGGKTWSKPKKLGENQHGHLLGPIKNKPVQLADGTIVCPTSVEYYDDNKELFWRVYFEMSKDNGKTWESTEYINDGVEFDAIQPSVLFYPNNKLQVLCRTRQSVVSQSWSEDGGKTWGEMTATSLPNPNSGTDAVTLKDGRQLLIYNHTIRKGGFPNGRDMINLAISEDGIDWKPVMTLERQKGEYSYPGIIQGKDGLVYITYTYDRQSVKHVVVDPDKL